MKKLKKIAGYIFLFCLVIFLISFLFKNSLPDENELVSSAYLEPVQQKVQNLSNIEKEYGDSIYTITPLYNYEFTSLVVSIGDDDSWYNELKNAFDPLNTRDLCVVWGNNLKNEVYKDFNFSSSTWRCHIVPKYNTDSKFNVDLKNDSLSNNHLLPSNDRINKLIQSTKIGDQVYIKGYLSSYKARNLDNKMLYSRGTSVTRDDSGDGACETIYVTDYKILNKQSFLRWLSGVSLYLVLTSFSFCVFLYLADIFSYAIFKKSL